MSMAPKTTISVSSLALAMHGSGGNVQKAWGKYDFPIPDFSKIFFAHNLELCYCVGSARSDDPTGHREDGE
ncbi:hypothetical protein HHK36_004714 [Tetracentron sinense]|uniref:Uncharacterized protein n=1 Tax=Tetracentron sinense TaxID=13715 RepID=A0A834ZSJ7_TETSI|nr:hypothetical protein HHK36_004714 [Tetracentron sinense]